MAKISSEDQFLKAIGARLRAIRLEKGWTLEETEEKGWSNWRHLQKIETGKNITLVTLRKLSILYKIELSKIFEGL